jgi:hypothetical protein
MLKVVKLILLYIKYWAYLSKNVPSFSNVIAQILEGVIFGTKRAHSALLMINIGTFSKDGAVKRMV